MEKTIKFGVIGCGLMGREFASASMRWLHLQTDLPRPQIIAACSRTDKSLDWFRRVPDTRYFYHDYHELLENPEVEAVYCAVPHDQHAQIYTDIIRSGKHLLAEKPFGIDLPACQQILSAMREHPQVFVRCSSEFPYYPAAQQLFRWYQEGFFGRVIEARFTIKHASDMDLSKPINWKRQLKTNGAYGCMGDLGIHTQHLPFRLGFRVDSVSAQLANLVPQRPCGDGFAPCETYDNAILLCGAHNAAGDRFPMVMEMKRMAPGCTNTVEYEIYGLNIVSVPTNRPVQRKDYPDAIYKTVEGKYRAVIEQVLECHKNGQPVLVGTVSVEKSETLAKMLQKYTRDFNVLNAKNHEREAEIVAQAGKKGAITIATNMAGRGTDIMLGGNAEFMAKAQMRKEHFCENLLNPDTPQDADPAAVELLLTEANGHGETTDANILAARQRFDQLYAQYKPAIDAEADEVRAAGGLFIIGTERHESRRIDNQLRGRAGRQGDPGASRFFLSLEDDLMRIFGGERVQGLMDTLGLDEDMPIENKLITNTIESAQKKLEGRNFEIRKNVLKYDDVMNQQREIIYGQRRKVLDGEDISAEMHNMLRENIDSSCSQFLAGDVKDDWDFGALRRHYQGWLTTDADFRYTVADFDNISREGIADMLYNRGMQILQAKEVRYGAPLMRELERICLLKCVDRQWMDHIDNMDQLRQGIALRGYGQKDPVVEYRIEGFDMFDQMVDSIRESSVKMLLTIELRAAGSAPKREQVAKPTGEGFVPGNGAPGVKGSPKGQPVRVVKIGRNDPCPCGSGLKFKKCTCAQYHPTGNNGGEE